MYYDKVVTLTPEEVLVETVDTKGAKLSDLFLTIDRTDNNRKTSLLSWMTEPDKIRPSLMLLWLHSHHKTLRLLTNSI